jgi:hypothetical protein
MKPEMISITTPDGFKLKVPAQLVATTFIAAALAHVNGSAPAPAAPSANDSELILGQYVSGQGGIYGGTMPARDGERAYHLIFASEDVGKRKWGGYEKESKATSKWDGLANTKALIEEGDHPAAEASAAYTSDGHKDFYLPSGAELYEAWLSIPDAFSKDWYWSSTQRSANNAFIQYFVDGLQYSSGKDGERRVRPVRRLFI